MDRWIVHYKNYDRLVKDLYQNEKGRDKIVLADLRASPDSVW
jgi:hypothetical protein